MRRFTLSLVVALVSVLFFGSTAAAAPGARAGTYAAFTTTSAAIAPGFPTATVVSTDPALAAATTATLPGASAFGAVFGTSAGRTHLSLHPIGAGVPTATTVSFETPTPVGGWSFALGDVDSDAVTISALDPTGVPVTSAQLGEQGAFNYAPGQTDLPVWDAATATLTGNVISTDGASDWFTPTVALRSITFTVTQQSGAPVVYLWMAAITATLAGVVTDPAGAPVPGSTVTLTPPSGGLATQVSAPDGSFEFPSVYPSDVVLSAAAPGFATGSPATISPTAGAYPAVVALATGAAILAEPGDSPQLAAGGDNGALVGALGVIALSAGALLAAWSSSRASGRRKLAR